MLLKPLIYYIDDEPNNLTVFEACLPEDWDVKVFESPIDALKTLTEDAPAIIVSDQRMPAMTGVVFLELAKKLLPNSVRVIVTGFSDEDLVIDSVRRAQIFDYIRKPWDADELVNQLERAWDFFKINSERLALLETLQEKNSELEQRNQSLLKLMKELEEAKRKESHFREELASWVPPFVLKAIENDLKFPMRRDIVGITFDIVDSSKLHGLEVDGRSIHGMIIKKFSESIIRHGGWRESHSGDSAYGHFGLIDQIAHHADSALAVAREFRVYLRNLNTIHGCEVECGIALHIAQNCLVNVHEVNIETASGLVKQKSFDTTSADIDLLHRIESIAHQLPGSNIIMSSPFFNRLNTKPPHFLKLGWAKLKGQTQAIELYMIPSDKITENTLQKFLSEKPFFFSQAA